MYSVSQMSARKIAVAVALTVLLIPARALAEEKAGEYEHITVPFVIEIGGLRLKADPGYYLSEGVHDRLDLRLKDAEDRATRAEAESRSLKESAGLNTWLLVGACTAALLAGGMVGVLAF